jgi:hypothetical protein
MIKLCQNQMTNLRLQLSINYPFLLIYFVTLKNYRKRDIDVVSNKMKKILVRPFRTFIIKSFFCISL